MINNINVNVIDVRVREDNEAKMISFEFNDGRQIGESGYVAFVFLDNSIQVDRYIDGDLMESYSDDLFTEEEKQMLISLC